MPSFNARLLERSGGHAAGVVDEKRDGTARLAGLTNRELDRSDVGDIDRLRENAGRFRRRRFELLLVATGDGDAPASAAQRLGDRKADAAAAASDKCVFSSLRHALLLHPGK